MNLFPPTNTPSPAQVNAALLILRIGSALAFLYHGSAILFGAFGGPGPQKFAAFLHLPVVVGYLVGLAQFSGGLAILSGVLIRLGAACVIVVMLVLYDPTRRTTVRIADAPQTLAADFGAP